MNLCNTVTSSAAGHLQLQWSQGPDRWKGRYQPSLAQLPHRAQGRDQRPSVTITLINGYIIIHFCLRYLTLGNQVSFPFKTHEGEGGNGWHPWSFMSLALKTG